MRELECTGTKACEKYCRALGAGGVDVKIGQTACNVPGMFTINQEANKVAFNEVYDDSKPRADEDMINGLGSALLGTLLEHQKNEKERLKVREIIEAHKNVLGAHMGLWQAMLGATRDGGREFTDVEYDYYTDIIAKARTARNETIEAIADQDIAVTAQAAFDRWTLDTHKLLFDDQLIADIDRIVPNMTVGKPTLLTGDKGIAKTEVLKFVTKLFDPTREPLIISGHGDMMSNEFMGQLEQDKESGRFEFKLGILPTAMKEGLPIIQDEINIGDQAIVMRTQDFLIRRPGEQVTLQENGETIDIQYGFVPFATENEASARYGHRSVLDPAYRDRYEPVHRKYPDCDGHVLSENPTVNLRIAMAACVDHDGNYSKHVDLGEVKNLAKLAQMTQFLYSVPAEDAKVALGEGFGARSDYLAKEPAMTECITPRKLYETVRLVAQGNRGLTLQQATEQLVHDMCRAGSDNKQFIDAIMLYLSGRLDSDAQDNADQHAWD